MKSKAHLGWRIRRIDLLIRYRLREMSIRLIPPAQMRMIEFIENNDGCTQAVLADWMRVSPASVAQSLKRMEAAGYVRRDACPGNLRANCLHITEEGRTAYESCRAVFKDLENAMFKDFEDSEQEQLIGLLTRLIENLESVDTDGMNDSELSKLVCAEE